MSHQPIWTKPLTDTQQRVVDTVWLYLVLGTSFFGLSLMPQAAYAANTTLQDVICSVVGIFVYGATGQALATIAVSILGIGALLGKINWGAALTTAVGITIMFSAPQVVRMLTGHTACNQASTFNADTLSRIFCHVAFVMGGPGAPVAKILGTIAVQILAIGALLGKISWNAALVVAVGIAIIFSAGALVEYVTRRNVLACGALGYPLV